MGAHIDVNNDRELYMWARTFRVTPAELVRLVGEVGPSAERVRNVLKKSEVSRSGRRLRAAKPKT